MVTICTPRIMRQRPRSITLRHTAKSKDAAAEKSCEPLCRASNFPGVDGHIANLLLCAFQQSRRGSNGVAAILTDTRLPAVMQQQIRALSALLVTSDALLQVGSDRYFSCRAPV